MDKFKQLHNMQSFEPLQANDLIKEQKREALCSIMFLKEKCYGRIKGQTCADSRKQQGQIPKEDAASPTVALESMLITSMIDAKEIATLLPLTSQECISMQRWMIMLLWYWKDH
eukprot:1788713-Ditylum_brightwellii.AAC.2